MSTADTFDIVVDLSTKTVINIRIFSKFFIIPESCCHFFKRFPLKFLSQVLILSLDFNSIQILMDTIQKLLHKLMSIFLLPVNKEHTNLR